MGKLTAAEKSARYRAKDIDAYREKKNALVKTDHHRAVRAKYARLWREKNKKPAKPRERRKTDDQVREKKREGAKAYRERNREKLTRLSAEYYHANKNKPEYREKVREYHLKRKYGLTLDEYRGMLEGQEGRCKICRVGEANHKNGWHVDHCHTSGAVRGILCPSCNTKLGWFEGNRDAILAYLNNT